MTKNMSDAEINAELDDYEALKELILELLPYEIDDGEDPPDQATPEECVEYAADEIARLKAKNSVLRAALVRMIDAVEKECRPRYPDLADAFVNARRVLDKKTEESK